MADETYTFPLVPTFQRNVTTTLAAIKAEPWKYFSSADIVWMMTSSALVLLMVPGAALFYSGYSEAGSVRSLMWAPVMTTTVIGLQWYLWGYSIAFSPSSMVFWGGTDGIAFHNVQLEPVGQEGKPPTPELLYALYQGMFACFTATLVSGAMIGKARAGHFLIFIFIWSTLVYDPIARWTWATQGWSNKWGVYDFAGGTAVHICSGASAAAFSLFYRYKNHKFERHLDMSVRRDNGRDSPSSVVKVVLGCTLLWVGWFGFNGGSALGANMRAVSACVSTHFAACAGGVTACLLERLNQTLHLKAKDKPTQEEITRGKFSIIAFCSGVVVGLVAITPAAGYVPASFSPLFGIVAVVVVTFTSEISKIAFRIDPSKSLFDTLEIFTIHAVAGFVGMFMTGIFARKDIPLLDGFSFTDGGGLNGNGVQIGKQIVDAIAGFSYSFVVTLGILFVMDLTLGRWSESYSLRAETWIGDHERVVEDGVELMDVTGPAVLQRGSIS